VEPYTKIDRKMSNVDQQIRTTVDELLKAISTKNIIAEPIEVGDSVIITITKVGLGFGTGMGTRGNGNGAGSGMGAGGAAGVSPVAIVVIHKSIPGPGGIEVKSLSPPGPIGKAIGDIASIIVERIGSKKPKSEEKEAPKA
jgi:uncharacterized spore protein YtfJ